MPSKNWKLKPHVSEEFCSDVSLWLSSESRLAVERRDKKFPEFSTLGAQLLYNRGFNNKEEVLEFINPKYEDLHDPFLFQDMQKAVDRIWHAIENKEGICVYGDYDADAVTANAVLQQTFKYLGVIAESYIPDRFTEGYGLNLEAFEKIKGLGCKLVITVDCGTNSTEVADWCGQNGIDLIITDHHEVIGDLPKAYAVINPKNPKDKYPYNEITGVGVAFKLASALLNDPRTKIQVINHKDGWEKWLLDLVAIGTVADCHSLLGENRILVKYGLKVLAKTKWVGLKALMNAEDINPAVRPLDTYTLGFIIAPRINAAGRLEHANLALNLLVSKSKTFHIQEQAHNLEIIEQKAEHLTEDIVVQLAAKLTSTNAKRQDLTKAALSNAKEKILQIMDRKVLIVQGDWNKGIVGLVAGKIAEEYHKPTIVLANDGDSLTGSARTVRDFNIVEALKHSSQYLIRFGGHQQAAGLTLHPKDFDAFYQKVLEYADINLSDEDLQPNLELEAELDGSQLSIANCQLLQQFEPFGVENPKPKFLVSGVKILSTRAVGAERQHLQMKLEKDNVQINSIAFNQGFLEKTLKIGNTIDVACELMEDGWNGRKEVKLRIIDTKEVK